MLLTNSSTWEHTNRQCSCVLNVSKAHTLERIKHNYEPVVAGLGFIADICEWSQVHESCQLSKMPWHWCTFGSFQFMKPWGLSSSISVVFSCSGERTSGPKPCICLSEQDLLGRANISSVRTCLQSCGLFLRIRVHSPQFVIGHARVAVPKQVLTAMHCFAGRPLNLSSKAALAIPSLTARSSWMLLWALASFFFTWSNCADFPEMRCLNVSSWACFCWYWTVLLDYLNFKQAFVNCNRKL